MIDSSLKKIVVDGRKLYYKIITDTDGIYLYKHTNFYETNSKYTLVKKHVIFGKLIKKHDNKVIFYINQDIEDEKYTKDDVKGFIVKELKLLDRKKEINKGEII